MDSFVVKDGKKLRLGFTTGSCAAAAAKAAARMLLTGERPDHICLITPKNITLDLPILEISRDKDTVSCAVRKDSGDDPDITNGALIYASVSRIPEPDILIDGGIGVGRVTKRGLDQPVGAAAINSVPRQMIRDALTEVCRFADYHGGLSVIISVPEGENLAKKTFNPRLGIIGGISILGTSGIVEPMSDQAMIDAIRVELKQRKANGADYVLLTPGNYGMDFIISNINAASNIPVMISNYVGDALDICRELDFRGILLIGHIGKLVKIAGNMLNTHSRYGDCRMEILASYGGASGLSSACITEVLNCAACDEAIRILKENSCFDRTMELLLRNVDKNLSHRLGESIEIGAIIFSKEYGILCETGNARSLLHHITEE